MSALTDAPPTQVLTRFTQQSLSMALLRWEEAVSERKRVMTIMRRVRPSIAEYMDQYIYISIYICI